MLANLNREEFIALLKNLGQEGDDDVLTAARDLHARIAVAGIDWDDLLVPEEDPDAEPEDDDDDAYAADDDAYADDDAAADDDAYADDDAAADDDDDDDDDDEVGADDDTDNDDGHEDAKLSDEQKKEAADLIAAISGLEVSAATKEDMKEYKQDLADGEFDATDLKYLHSLRARLGK